MKLSMKKACGMLLAAAMTVSLLSAIPQGTAQAKKLSPKKRLARVSATKSIRIVYGDFDANNQTVYLINEPSKVKVTYRSSNKKIAKVSKKGVVRAVAPGKCKVLTTVRYKGKKRTLKTSVNVVTVAPTTVSTSAAIRAQELGVTLPDNIHASNIGASHLSANGIGTVDNGMMRTNISSRELMFDMGNGWNLSNTMEATGDDYFTKKATVTEYETAWGMPVTTKEMIDGVKKAGFNTVRIPVAWSNMVTDEEHYTIPDAYFNRVEEIMNYCLSNGMYVIINEHWDYGWFCQFAQKSAKWQKKAWARYESYWTQIATRFREYSDHLIFESQNEELGTRFADPMDPKTGFETDACYSYPVGKQVKQYHDLCNAINQKFVDVVRSTGGNNTYRHLLISGFDTSIDYTCLNKFKMPTDSASQDSGKIKMMVSVHYYDPSGFTIASPDDNYYMDKWGSGAEYDALQTSLDKMNKFTRQGYGVIIGEYSAYPGRQGCESYLREVVSRSLKNGFVCCLWDTNSIYKRNDHRIGYRNLAQLYLDLGGVSGVADASLPDA